MFGIPAKQIVNKFFPKANPRDITKIINDKTHFFLTDTYRYIKRIPGVIEALNELKGKFKLAIITNSTMASYTAQAMNATNHNPSIFPTDKEVEDAWDTLEVIFRYILDPKPKQNAKNNP